MPDAESANAPSDSEPREDSGDTNSEPPESSDDTDTDEAAPERSGSRVLSAYGLVSAVLGVLLIASIVGCVFLWSSHRSDVDEHHYQTRAKSAAAEWALVLMNMNTDDLDASLRRLRDGTAGQLKAGFDSAMQPYREMVQRMPSHTATQIESVVIQSVHHELGDIATFPSAAPEPPHSEVGTRTDTIQVVATSISGNAGAKPATVYWNLLVDVSDVDDNLLISRLRALR